MTVPVDVLLSRLDWNETGERPAADGLPYATHAGVMELAGKSLRCFRLNTGRSVFHADDLAKLFGLASAGEFRDLVAKLGYEI